MNDNRPVGDPASGDFDPQDRDSIGRAVGSTEGVPLTRPEDKLDDRLTAAQNPLTDRDVADQPISQVAGEVNEEQIFFDNAEEEARDPQQLIGDSPSDVQAHALERMRVGGTGTPTTGA